jgi:hypothetical protein
VDVAALASSGATAIISAMATDAWTRVRFEVARLLAPDGARAPEVRGRLDNFVGDLSSTAERDVHNRLQGYLEAKLGDDPQMFDEFVDLIRRISAELHLEVPTQTVHGIIANSVVVQTAGGSTTVQIGHPEVPVVRWLAMTGPEAARKLEALDLIDAVEALANMEPSLAARRLTYVDNSWARQLLSHMDEGVAAELLQKTAKAGHAADLLAAMEPSQAAAILETPGGHCRCWRRWDRSGRKICSPQCNSNRRSHCSAPSARFSPCRTGCGPLSTWPSRRPNG